MTRRIVLSVVSGSNSDALPAFLESLWADTAVQELDLTCVVVANAPTEEHLSRIRSAARNGPAGRTQVLVHPARRGFAENHNIVLAAQHADYHVLSNDDVIVLPGTIRALVAFMEEDVNARVAVATPKLLNPDRSVQGCTYSFPSVMRVLASAAELRSSSFVETLLRFVGGRRGAGQTRYWTHDATMSVDSVRGAFVIVRREAIDDVGPMDEVAIVGGEELEWHRRMADSGWHVAFVHDVAVVHVGEQTVGGSPELKIEYVKGWLNFFQKHGRTIDVPLLRFGLAVIYSIRMIAGILRGDPRARRAASSGVATAVRWPRIWKAAVEAGLVHAVPDRSIKV